MDDDAVSVEQALTSGDVHELLTVWEDFNRGETWREVSATGSDQARAAAAQFLAEVREVAALEALRANAKAVELLTARRWSVMKSTREAGATWAQIGEALGFPNKLPMTSTAAGSRSRRSTCRTSTTRQRRARCWKTSQTALPAGGTAVRPLPQVDEIFIIGV
jgi:hypothetical protein